MRSAEEGELDSGGVTVPVASGPLDRRIHGVTLGDWRNSSPVRVGKPSCEWLANVVPGVLKVYDLPDLARTLEERKVSVVNRVPAGPGCRRSFSGSWPSGRHDLVDIEKRTVTGRDKEAIDRVVDDEGVNRLLPRVVVEANRCRRPRHRRSRSPGPCSRSSAASRDSIRRGRCSPGTGERSARPERATRLSPDGPRKGWIPPANLSKMSSTSARISFAMAVPRSAIEGGREGETATRAAERKEGRPRVETILRQRRSVRQDFDAHGWGPRKSPPLTAYAPSIRRRGNGMRCSFN